MRRLDKGRTIVASHVIAVHLFAQSPCDHSGPIPFEATASGVIYRRMGVVIPAQFDLAEPFTAEGAIACLANQCGLLGKDGSFITPTWNRQSRQFLFDISNDVGPSSTL